jgi:3-keto-5-aminohexanoate cleavage enzyme
MRRSVPAASRGRVPDVVRPPPLDNGDGVRTGLEDNIRITKHRLARSSTELVQMARETCAKYGRRPATPTQARALLRLER